MTRRPPSATHVEDTWVGASRTERSTSLPDDSGEDFPLLSEDPYDHGEEVARGGLGRIIRGFDRRLGRTVALKELITRDPKAELRFVREAKITARLEHPNIVPIHEAGRWPGGARFYAMKMVDGQTLSDALAESDALERRVGLLPHIIDVADAVAYAHSQGILHRDLKPANVMVGPFGETMVIDWGLAKDLAEPDLAEDTPRPNLDVTPSTHTETSDGIVVGTPPYMPPEQARADALDEKSDVYALGAMLYQVLTGRRPYEEIPPKDVLRAVVSGPPVPVEVLAPDLPRDLLAIVRTAMHRNPEHRYPSALEMAAELRRFSTGQLVAAHRYSPVERTRRFLRRHTSAAFVALVAALALGGFAVWSFNGLAQRTAAAEDARAEAEKKVQEFTLEKSRALLARDPTEAVAWLKRLEVSPQGAASIAAEAHDLGVAREVLQGHLQEVDIVRVDPRGRFVASGSRDETVRLWSSLGFPPRVLEHAARVSALAFGPDGRLLATGAYDGVVRLFRVEGQGPPRLLSGHDGPVVALAFAETGRLASLGRDGELRLWSVGGALEQVLTTPPVSNWGSVHFVGDRQLLSAGHGRQLILWNLETGESRVLAEIPTEISSVHPSRGQVAIGGVDGLVAVVDLDSGATRGLGGHDSEVMVVRLDPFGLRLASADLEGTIRVWSGDPSGPQVFDGHAERVTSLRFSPDGSWLASSSWDGTARLHDLRTGEVQPLRGHGQVVTDLEFTPDGNWLATASWDTSVRLWPVRRDGHKVLRGHRIGVHAVDFAPDGRSVLSGGHDDELRLWNLRTGEARVLSGHGDNVYRVVFSPQGRLVASSSDDRTVRVWDVATGREQVLVGHSGDVEELVFSPDGRHLASAGREGEVYLWEPATGKGVRLNGHDRAVTGLAFLIDGRLASSGLDGRVLVWPTDGGAPEVLREGEPVRGLHGSPDGRRLAAAGGVGDVWVWRFPDGKQIHVLEDLPEADLVRLSPDNSHVAVASARRGLWLCSLAYGWCDELIGHEARVFDVAFSPSGRALVSGSGDHSVRIWDVVSLESRVVRGHRAPVFDVDFSPDGAWVASGSGDTDVRVVPARLPPRPRRVPRLLEELTRYEIPDAP